MSLIGLDRRQPEPLLQRGTRGPRILSKVTKVTRARHVPATFVEMYAAVAQDPASAKTVIAGGRTPTQEGPVSPPRPH